MITKADMLGCVLTSQSKTPDGFSSMVILKCKNSKTQELVTLSTFKLPPSHKHLALKPTALEARHFAATYALFRVCSMRNIHMMLPPDYRDLWKGEFEVLKKQDVKDGHTWMYEADPFGAYQEREAAKAAFEKKRKADQQAREQASKTPAPGAAGLALRNNTGGIGSGSHNILRGWTRVPVIEMGKRTRASVEELIRKHAIWNPHDVTMSEYQKHSVVKELSALGFRESHIQEAVEECKDKEETLEWLLIHVPEDDLPPWALPEGYVAGISMASGNLKREGAIKRLAEAGYAQDLCEQMYDSTNDEGLAAVKLQHILLSSGQDYAIVETEPSWDSEDSIEQSAGLWEEELTGVQAVFGEKFSRPSQDMCKIMLQPANRGRNAAVSSPAIMFRRTSEYPQKVPMVSVIGNLPAYIRLSIIKQALKHASETLLGEPMVFFLVDWVEQNLYRIIEKPGQLREVSAAASTVSEIQPLRRKRQKILRHPRPIVWHPSPKNREDWMRRQSDPKLQAMVHGRKGLPAWAMRETIINLVNSNQVTIISGETGSGKSTQSAQFILDDMYQNGLGECAKIM